MIHCIVLAAGFGRRFPGEKLNALLDGKPMYRHVLDRLFVLQSERLCDVTLVTRPGALRDCPGDAVFNLRAEEGVSSSIRCGLNALPADESPVAFFVADQPYLTAETLRAFFMHYPVCGKGILAASHNGEAGNPVVFSRRYEPLLRALSGDRGGKAVLLRHPEDTALFEVPDEKELTDLDEGIRETEKNQGGTHEV